MAICAYLDEIDVKTAFWLVASGARRARATRTPSKAASLVLRLARIRVEKLDVDMQSPAREGGGLWYAHHDLARRVSKEIDRALGPLPADWPIRGIDPGRAAAARRQLVALDIHRPVVLGMIAQRESSGDPAIVLGRSGGLAELLTIHAGPLLGGVRFMDLPSRRHGPAWRLAKFVLDGMRAVLGAPFERSPSRRPPASVAAEFARGLRPEQGLSDTWFLEHAGIENGRVVVFFDRPAKAPATREAIEGVLKIGARPVVLSGASAHPAAPRKAYRRERARHVWPDLVAMVRAWRGAKGGRARGWLRAAWFRMVGPARRWQAFLEGENVRVVSDSAETVMDALALGCDLAGSVKIGVHWSDMIVPQSRIAHLQHLYFVWAPRFAEVSRAADGSPYAVLECGSIFDRLEHRSSWAAQASTTRRRLHEAGAQRILTVLDRTASANARVPPRYHHEFFDRMLELAETLPGLGIVLKPKSAGPQQAALTTRIDKLRREGRLEQLRPEAHALEGVMAGDLAVALDLSSAGTLAALAGRPMVYWSPCDVASGPAASWVAASGWADPGVRMRSLDELERRIRLWFEGGEPELGDSRKISLLADSFHDGRATERVGKTVAHLLRDLDKGLSATEALRGAVEAYALEWGTQHIHLGRGGA